MIKNRRILLSLKRILKYNGIIVPVLKTLGNGTKSSMGTSGSLDNLSPDGFTWASASPLLVDKNDNLIALAQDNSGNKEILFAVSSDITTWTTYSLAQNFLGRGTMAYDASHDMIHVLWEAQDPGDGIIYRRYTITYSGATITGITRDTNINLQLDFGGSAIYSPQLVLKGSVLLAIWGTQGTGGFETRSSMRDLSYTAADNTAENWLAPVTTSTTTIVQTPQVAYTALQTGSLGAFCSPILVGSDIYVFLQTSITDGILTVKKMTWNTVDWSGGLSSPVTIAQTKRAGVDGGYSLKYQLLTKAVLIGNLLYIGFANWKDNTSGDTFSFKSFNTSDDSVSSYIDVYSASGAHSYAPTGDIAYDSVGSQLVVSYSKTTSLFAYIKTYDTNNSQIQGETLLTDIDQDIPVLLGNTRFQDKLVSITRNTNSNGSAPYQGYVSTMTYS